MAGGSAPAGGTGSQFMANVTQNVIAVQDSIVRHVRNNRGGRFHVSHWQEITEIKQSTPEREGISRSTIRMYREAARFHHECIRGMTDTIHPHDEPWLENIQAPAVIQLLKEQDPQFQQAVDRLIQAIARDEHRAVERTVMARYTGQYGPTWIFGDRGLGPGERYLFGGDAVPGTQRYLYRTLLDHVEADDHAKGAIAGTRVTSYANMVGLSFCRVLGEGGSLNDAIQAEKEMLIRQWEDPMAAQKRLMEEMDFSSFDVQRYMEELKALIAPYLQECAREGVSYRNIIWIPTLIGDLHHVGQMAYNMCKDDMTMAVFEAVARCLERTLKAGVASLSDINRIPIFDITATACAYILSLDGITASDVAYLINQRHRRLIARNPQMYQREDMNELFVRYIETGERILAAGSGKPQIDGWRIDLSPIDDDPVIQDPASYTWGQLPITARFAAIIKFVDEPFMLISDPAWGPIWVCGHADPAHPSNRTPF